MRRALGLSLVIVITLFVGEVRFAFAGESQAVLELEFAAMLLLLSV